VLSCWLALQLPPLLPAELRARHSARLPNSALTSPPPLPPPEVGAGAGKADADGVPADVAVVDIACDAVAVAESAAGVSVAVDTLVGGPGGGAMDDHGEYAGAAAGAVVGGGEPGIARLPTVEVTAPTCDGEDVLEGIALVRAAAEEPPEADAGPHGIAPSRAAISASTSAAAAAAAEAAEVS